MSAQSCGVSLLNNVTAEFALELSAKTLWPLFPLLLLVVVVCLTWAMVYVVRLAHGRQAVWVQAGALIFYLLAAASAIASESGGMSAHVHRPFSILTQGCMVWAMYRAWGQHQRKLFLLNAVAWAAILADTALHYVLVK